MTSTQYVELVERDAKNTYEQPASSREQHDVEPPSFASYSDAQLIAELARRLGER